MSGYLFCLFIGFVCGAGWLRVMGWLTDEWLTSDPRSVLRSAVGHPCSACGKPTQIAEMHPGERAFHGDCFRLAPASRSEGSR